MQRIIVNVKNEIGVIADLTSLLADQGINIVGIDTEGSDASGVVVISTEDTEHHQALLAIANAGYKAISDESLVIRLRDEPGALAKIAERFRRHNINILSLHIVNRTEGFTTVSLSADDFATARKLVKDQLVETS